MALPCGHAEQCRKLLPPHCGGVGGEAAACPRRSRSGRHSGPIIEMAGTTAAHDQVETATSFALLILGCAQSLDSTLFFRGISFCSNGAGRCRNLTQRSIGIKSSEQEGTARFT